MKTFGERLRKERVFQGLSGEMLAECLGYTRNAISQYEAGSREPNLESLVKICTELSVTADYLLGLSDIANVYDYLKYPISEDEYNMILKYRKFPEETKAAINRIYSLQESEDDLLEIYATYNDERK